MNNSFVEGFTNVNNLTSSYLTTLFLSILSNGFQLNQECWLHFPYNCYGCEFREMMDFTSTLEDFQRIDVYWKMCNTLLRNEETEMNIDDKSLFERLHNEKYEPSIRPHFPYEVDVINVGLQIIAVEDLDISDSSFTIDLIIYQQWYDRRLKHFNGDLLDGSTFGIKIWKPDTYFVQSKQGKFIDKVRNDVIRIRKDGLVYYRSRLIVKVSCPLDFHHFPMDEQLCILNLESYGYETADIIYKWGVDKISNVLTTSSSFDSITQYTLKPIETTSNITKYVVGHWSTLSIKLRFVRNSIIFIPAMYFPCAIIVFISWITFLLDTDHYPARTYLCVTSLLTIITMQAAMNLTLPKVSYIKAIDVYVLTCTLFIALAFVEYAFILFIQQKVARHKEERESYLVKHKKQLELKKNSLYYRGGHGLDYDRFTDSTVTSRFWVIKKPEIWSCFSKIFMMHLKENWALKLDNISRVLFPTTFIIFNVIYWTTSGLFWVKKEEW